MTELRVRVELVDTPGALAAATTALAVMGVNVAAIDVLEVDARTVVDELLLRLPAGVTAQEVEDGLRLAGAVEILSSVESRSAEDASVRSFHLVRDVLANPSDADAPGRALARCAYADVGMLVDVEDAARYPLAARALADGVPAAGRAAPDVAPLALPSGWVLWVAPQLPAPTRLAVVGRRLNVRFSATEAARLRALVTLLETMARLPA